MEYSKVKNRQIMEPIFDREIFNTIKSLLDKHPEIPKDELKLQLERSFREACYEYWQ